MMSKYIVSFSYILWSVAFSRNYKPFNRISIKINLLCMTAFSKATVYQEQAVQFLNNNFGIHNNIMTSC